MMMKDFDSNLVITSILSNVIWLLLLLTACRLLPGLQQWGWFDLLARNNGMLLSFFFLFSKNLGSPSKPVSSTERFAGLEKNSVRLQRIRWWVKLWSCILYLSLNMFIPACTHCANHSHPWAIHFFSRPGFVFFYSWSIDIDWYSMKNRRYNWTIGYPT